MNDVYTALKVAIGRSEPRDRWSKKFLGKPSIKFVLDREFNRYSKLLSYDFVSSLYDISGISILDAYVSSGCIDIQLRLATHVDYKGRDIRFQIVNSTDYHSLFSRFDVRTIYLHCFPNASNYDSRMILGPLGRPYRAG